MDITQFYQTFFEEADELLAQMEQGLLGLDLQTPDGEDLNAIFRAAHSIKGGAATFGFVALTDTTHLLENLLDRTRHGELKLSTRMMDAFLETKDVLQQQLGAYRAGGEPEPEMVAQICAVLRQLALEGNGGAAPAAAAAPAVSKSPAIAPPPAAPAAPVASTPEVPTLKVRFNKVSENDQKLLGEEMENLGTVLSQARDVDCLTVWLQTTCDANDIVAVSCFIVEADQIEITTEPACAAVAEPEIAAMPLPLPVNTVAVAVAAVEVSAPRAAAAPAAPAASAAAAPGKESNSIRVDVE
ncbi:MAG: Hpt domain-containing protein, partial [Polaromonas sp.]